MSTSIVTQVMLVSVNEISDEDKADVIDRNDADDIADVAESMEEDVESLLAHRVFGESDAIPIINVDTSVEDGWDEDDYTDLRVGEEQ